MITYNTLAHFAQSKKELHTLTGSDAEYYRILREAGYAKSSHIPSNAEGWPVLARLREQVAEVKYRADEAEAIREFGGG